MRKRVYLVKVKRVRENDFYVEAKDKKEAKRIAEDILNTDSELLEVDIMNHLEPIVFIEIEKTRTQL